MMEDEINRISRQREAKRSKLCLEKINDSESATDADIVLRMLVRTSYFPLLQIQDGKPRICKVFSIQNRKSKIQNWYEVLFDQL
jgi:hypothetical protein